MQLNFVSKGIISPNVCVDRNLVTIWLPITSDRLPWGHFKEFQHSYCCDIQTTKQHINLRQFPYSTLNMSWHLVCLLLSSQKPMSVSIWRWSFQSVSIISLKNLRIMCIYMRTKPESERVNHFLVIYIINSSGQKCWSNIWVDMIEIVWLMIRIEFKHQRTIESNVIPRVATHTLFISLASSKTNNLNKIAFLHPFHLTLDLY